ncbi:MAG: protein kinase, partial [Planctomycetota bacterium]
PENIFILAGGQFEVMIMDFGLAKRIQEIKGEDVFKTVAGEIVGSPAYIAPETVQCDPVDGRTDLYSVGIMLFECLTGKRPIDSLSSVGFLTAHMVAPPLTLIEAAPDRKWPAAAEKLVARLLEKSRDERPKSAAEALEELTAVAPELIGMGLPEGAQPADQALTKRMLSMTLLGRLATPSPAGASSLA